MFRVARTGACVAAVTALAACSGAAPSGQAEPSRPAPSVSTEATTSPQPARGGSRGSKRTITIALAGDIHFEGSLRGRLSDPSAALAPAAAQLAAADVTIVNLETSVGRGGRPEPGKRYAFQAPPSAFTALARAGVDVASMANNHAMDYGAAALGQTFRAVDVAATADPPLQVVGVGADADAAFRPARIDVRGTEVAVVAATAASLDPTADPTSHWAATADSPGTADVTRSPARLLREVGRADRTADVVVVYLHWGVQGARCPSTPQRTLARRLLEAGADVVAGSHAHLLQGAGRAGDGYVAYGLGNYVWYTPTPADAPTGVLTLAVRPPAAPAARAVVTDASWSLARIGGDGLPEVLAGDAVVRAQREIAALRDCAGLAP